MCRYATTTYREHLLCLPCRFAFKGSLDGGGERRCPRCAGDVLDMGLDFRPPRRHDDNQWRKIEMLVADGIRFHSCGCNGPGPRPRTLADAKAQRRDRTRAAARGSIFTAARLARAAR